MSRTVKGSKGCGFEYWGKRALSQCDPGRITKKHTSGIERTRERQMIHDNVRSLECMDNINADES